MSFTSAGKIEQALLPDSFGGDYHFERVSAFTCRRRHYRIRCAKTLWEEYAVERSWSKNLTGRAATRIAYFRSEEEALKFLRKVAARRLKKGYRPVGLIPQAAGEIRTALI